MKPSIHPFSPAQACDHTSSEIKPHSHAVWRIVVMLQPAIDGRARLNGSYVWDVY